MAHLRLPVRALVEHLFEDGALGGRKVVVDVGFDARVHPFAAG